MEANFRKSMPQHQANAILAALPGAHAFGRVHSTPRRNEYQVARRDGDPLVEQSSSIAQQWTNRAEEWSRFS